MTNNPHNPTPDSEPPSSRRNGSFGHDPRPEHDAELPAADVTIEELLSAAHDGELTSAEQSRLSLAMQNAPALQEQLEEIQDLSTLLRSLARPSAPTSLKPAILERIGPLLAADSATQPKAATDQPQSWKRSLLLWGSSIAAAAMVVLAVQLSGQFFTPNRPSELADHTSNPESAILLDQEGDQFGRPGNSAVALEKVSELERMLQQGGLEAGFNDTLSKPHEAMTGVDAEGIRAGSVPAPAMAASGLTPGSAASPPLIMQNTQTDGLALPEMKKAFYEGMGFDPHLPPNIGDEFSTFLTQGDIVAQVTARVVDVDPMGDHTLVLMRGEAFKVLSQDPASGTKDDLQRRLGVPQDGEMVIVFWQAPAAQIAQVKLELDQISLTKSNDKLEPQEAWNDRRVALRHVDRQLAPIQNARPEEKSSQSESIADAAPNRNAADSATTSPLQMDRKKPQMLAESSKPENRDALDQRPPSPALPDSDRAHSGFANSVRSRKQQESAEVAGSPRSASLPAVPGDNLKLPTLPEAQQGRRMIDRKEGEGEGSSQPVVTESFGVRMSLVEYQQLQRKIAGLPQASHLLDRFRSAPAFAVPMDGDSSAKAEDPKGGNAAPKASPRSIAAKPGEARQTIELPPGEAKRAAEETGITVILYSAPAP